MPREVRNCEVVIYPVGERNDFVRSAHLLGFSTLLGSPLRPKCKGINVLYAIGVGLSHSKDRISNSTDLL